jgi:hypothetical protein
VAIQLPPSYAGQVVNDTTASSYGLIPGGTVCAVGGIQTGPASPQQYYAWQSPVATGNLVVSTCIQSPLTASFDTKLFVLNTCPSASGASGSAWASCVGSNDDTLCGGAGVKQSKVSLVTNPGQMYYFMVTGKRFLGVLNFNGKIPVCIAGFASADVGQYVLSWTWTCTAGRSSFDIYLVLL